MLFNILKKIKNMASIPFSIILSQKSNILPLSDIQEHQKFCKAFLKAHHNFEKYNNNSKSKITFTNDNVFLYNSKNQKKQNQIDILNWLISLSLEERLSIFSIKNKWLTNIFIQMCYIYYKMGNYSYKPKSDMCVFFKEQKNFSQKEENSNMGSVYMGDIDNKKTKNSGTTIEQNSNKKNEKNGDEYEYDEMNLISSYFEIKEINDNNYINSEKREKEKKLVDYIRIINNSKDTYDTITFTKDFVNNIDLIKKFLDYFSGNNYFQNWLIPINIKNIYNFIMPFWMHNIELSLCQIIMGYFEQKIVVNYEYYYYTKKLYELSFDKQIAELYKENKELEKFIINSYSFNGNNKNKEEIFTSEKIIQTVDELRENEKFNLRLKMMKDIFNKICEEKACYKGKEIALDDELGLETYHYLNDEILKGKENHYISKLLDLITFSRIIDIINFKNFIFANYRQKLINLQCNFVLNELQSEEYTHKKSNKKHKKKKKKDNNEEKKTQNVITKTNVIKIPLYQVQTNEIECEYNMQQFNMIQENTTNVSINSQNNNNIVITENKIDIKKEIPKSKELNKKEEAKKEEMKKDENKKEEIKKEEECKEKIKEKKSKEFFLFPINNNNKKKGEKNNKSSNNEIKEKQDSKNPKTKNKNKKGKKDKTIKENNNNNITLSPKKIFKFNNYVQERKNIVQINPCPRRKKHFLLQTSSMNFEMHMKPPRSFPSINSKPQNNKDNINIMTNTLKSHWDYFQYNNNQSNSLQMFNSFVPSEKYFESLNQELNNYLSVTNFNISNLKNLQEQNLTKIENFIQSNLSDNYDIKFGHYGSFFTNLNIEGSDLDILIYYKKKKEENDFLKDILNLLQSFNPNFYTITPILTASVPVIKLTIDIKEEIKDLKLKNKSYLDEDDLTKIKIDLTFTESEKEFQSSKDTVDYIKNSVVEYPQIKSMLQILKRYFKIMGMNKSYTGGLCSYSLFLLVLSFCKCNKQCLSPTKLLYYFMENFTYFDYCNYCIDVKSDNCYILKDKEKGDLNIEKSVSEENSSFDTNYDLYEKEEIFIIDPISNMNVSKSSFRVDEIILTFRKGFNLLYYEGWRYDFYKANNKDNETNNICNNDNNDIIGTVKEFCDEDDALNYMTIKKLFNLQVFMNNYDFYFN